MDPRLGMACVEGMLDLAATSGLPLWLDRERRTLLLTQPMQTLHPQPLPMAGAPLPPPAEPSPETPYLLFPDVILPTDKGVFGEFGVRHNLLLLQPGRSGQGCAITRSRTLARPNGTPCPQAYGVLHGRGLFLLPGEGPEWERPTGSLGPGDVRWIAARAGQKVIVPPGYGVMLVNQGAEPLVLSNLEACEAQPLEPSYEPPEAGEYRIVERGGQAVVEASQPLTPVERREPLSAPELGVVEDLPLYSAFVHHPDRFGWLRGGMLALAGVC